MTPEQSAHRYIAEHVRREGRKPDSVPFTASEWQSMKGRQPHVRMVKNMRKEFGGILVRIDHDAAALRESYLWSE
jgi:hypothetical protein